MLKFFTNEKSATWDLEREKTGDIIQLSTQINHIEDKFLSCASYLVFSIVEKLTKKKTKKAKYTDGNFCGQGKRTPNGR